MAFLLLFSAFFSGSETAFFSLNSLEKDALRRRSRGRRGRYVDLLFVDPDQVLVTILTGNMLVNIIASSLSEAIGDELFVRSSELLSIASMTVILLVLGEMTPKNVAVRHSLRFSGIAAGVLPIIHTVLRPVTRPLGRLRHAVISAWPGGGDRSDARAEAVLSAIRMGFQSRTIEESELRLLERFFRFRDKTAAEVMTPRVDCRPVNASMRVRDLVAAATSSCAMEVPRLIPLYREDVDHIAGYVSRADLVSCRLSGELDRKLSEFARPIHAVPSGKDLRELLEEMSERRAEMAVVLDEYGGTHGIVTLGTVMEYLFSDFAATEDQLLVAVDETSWRVAGSLDVDDAEAALGVALPTESRTIGGMVTDLLDDLPTIGAYVTVAGHRFTVESVEARRIVWLTVGPEVEE